MQRIVGKLRQPDAREEAQQWVMTEMSKSPDQESFVAEIQNVEIAASAYAASPLTREVDKDAVRTYLQQLA